MLLQSSMPPVVQLSSTNCSEQNPIMVVVRQPKQVLSWQVPLSVDNETGVAYFYNTSRTLCYDEIATMGSVYTSFNFFFLKYNYSISVGSNLKSVWVVQNPIISISTAYEESVEFELLVKHRTEFIVEPGKLYNLEVSPSTPM